jgi:hypothetical protein
MKVPFGSQKLWVYLSASWIAPLSDWQASQSLHDQDRSCNFWPPHPAPPQNYPPQLTSASVHLVTQAKILDSFPLSLTSNPAAGLSLLPAALFYTAHTLGKTTMPELLQ